MGDFEGKAEELIPATVRMISGCQDNQTSADVSNVSQFELPDPAGRSGGACTSALLKVLYADHLDTGQDLSFVEVLMKMREFLHDQSYTQVPQLSCSRKMDVNETFRIHNGEGARRAILIGINYVGQQGQLSGCHNDVGNIKDYIMDVHGFQEEDITVLMDDGDHEEPTYDNIISAFRSLVSQTEAGDCAFVHYSGHGGRLRDDDGDEEDGYDETLIPVDYQSAGQIRDDVVFSELVGRMPEGSTLTCLMDCCHSGSVLDLPYTFKADGEQEEMQENPRTDFSGLKAMAISYLVRKIFGTGVTGQIATMVILQVLSGFAAGGAGGGSTKLSADGGSASMVLSILRQLAGVKCG